MLEKLPFSNYKLLAEYNGDALKRDDNQNDRKGNRPHIQEKIVYLLSTIFTTSTKEIPYSSELEKIVYASLCILDRVRFGSVYGLHLVH